MPGCWGRGKVCMSKPWPWEMTQLGSFPCQLIPLETIEGPYSDISNHITSINTRISKRIHNTAERIINEFWIFILYVLLPQQNTGGRHYGTACYATTWGTPTSHLKMPDVSSASTCNPVPANGILRKQQWWLKQLGSWYSRERSGWSSWLLVWYNPDCCRHLGKWSSSYILSPSPPIA